MDDKKQITLSHTSHWQLENAAKQKYCIQISWPLQWERAVELREKRMPVMYIVDGNAHFLSAAEIAWRREASPYFAGGAIVVAIGYNLEGYGYLYGPRRSHDLTPPGPDCPEDHGGADDFLDFILSQVRPLVARQFPHITIGSEALFGHSYGGLFVLHTLFKRPDSFQHYVACSPSIWWSDKFILTDEKEFSGRNISAEKKPSLYMFYGSLEQNCRKMPKESDEQFGEREKGDQARAMIDNIWDMYKRLEDSQKLSNITVKGYEGEDHGSVAGCALSRAITSFVEEWSL